MINAGLDVLNSGIHIQNYFINLSYSLCVPIQNQTRSPSFDETPKTR